MKAIVNGKVILKDQVAEGLAVLYTDKIEGVVSAEELPAGALITSGW